MELTLNYN